MAPTTHMLAKQHSEHVKAIGMIALETVDLELALADLFSRMLQINRKTATAIYMTPKGDQARLDILSNAAHAAFDLTKREQEKPLGVLPKQKKAALKKVLEIVKRAHNAINNRHRMMHDDWQPGDDDKTAKRKTVDGRAGRAAVAVSIGDLKQQIATLRTLIDDVHDLTNEFDQHPPLMVDMRRDAGAAAWV